MKKNKVKSKKFKYLFKALGSRGFLNWLPDKLYLKMIYYAETGKKLNLISPKTFNEKIQWLKLYDRREDFIKYVDKFAVREYIKTEIGDDYLIPLISVYDKVEDIEWEKLPNQFVLKCNHGSHSNIICMNKDELDIDYSKKKLKKWLKKNWFWYGRAWPYKQISPKIICEKYIQDENDNDLKDYKIMCFNGEPKIVLVCSERHSNSGVMMSFYDTNWNLLPIKRPNVTQCKDNKKPKNLELMLELSRRLAKGLPFIRVDLYEVNGKIYFGELTLYPTSGFKEFYPDEYNEILGGWIKLPIDK